MIFCGFWSVDVNIMYKLFVNLYLLFCYYIFIRCHLQFQKYKGLQIGWIDNVANDFVGIFIARAQKCWDILSIDIRLLIFHHFVITHALKWWYFHFLSEICYHQWFGLKIPIRLRPPKWRFLGIWLQKWDQYQRDPLGHIHEWLYSEQRVVRLDAL